MRPGREIDGTLRLCEMWPGVALLVTVNADGIGRILPAVSDHDVITARRGPGQVELRERAWCCPGRSSANAAIAVPPPWGTRLTVAPEVNSAPWIVSVVEPPIAGLCRADARDLQRQRCRGERERLAAGRAGIALNEDVVRAGLRVGNDDLLGRLRRARSKTRGSCSGSERSGSRRRARLLARRRTPHDRDVFAGGHSELVIEALAAVDRAGSRLAKGRARNSDVDRVGRGERRCSHGSRPGRGPCCRSRRSRNTARRDARHRDAQAARIIALCVKPAWCSSVPSKRALELRLVVVERKNESNQLPAAELRSDSEPRS